MITLKRLKWNNCFSYGDNNELDLDSSNVTQIIGKNGNMIDAIKTIVNGCKVKDGISYKIKVVSI